MLEKVRLYYEREYEDCKKGIKKNYCWATPLKLVESSIQNCLAIAMFVQTIGVPFAKINPLYEEYVKKLNSLLRFEDDNGIM